LYNTALPLVTFRTCPRRLPGSLFSVVSNPHPTHSCVPMRACLRVASVVPLRCPISGAVHTPHSCVPMRAGSRVCVCVLQMLFLSFVLPACRLRITVLSRSQRRLPWGHEGGGVGRRGLSCGDCGRSSEAGRRGFPASGLAAAGRLRLLLRGDVKTCRPSLEDAMCRPGASCRPADFLGWRRRRRVAHLQGTCRAALARPVTPGESLHTLHNKLRVNPGPCGAARAQQQRYSCCGR